MELRQLETFAVLAEELHFRRAAERLYVTPAAVTKVIQALERELSLQLFDRNPRRVALTPAGAELLAPALDLLAAATELKRRATTMGTGRTALRLAYIPSQGALMAALVEAARESRPQLVISPCRMANPRVVELVRRAPGVVGIVHGEGPAYGLPGIELGEHALNMLAVPARHRLAHREMVTIADLADETYLITTRAYDLDAHQRIVEFFRRNDISLRMLEVALESAVDTLDLVAAEAGIAMLPGRIADTGDPPYGLSGVRLVPLAPPHMVFPISLVWNPSRPNPLGGGLLAESRRWRGHGLTG